MTDIPTVPGGGNHTLAFAEAAGTEAAHEACLDVSKALAAVGMRVLADTTFLPRVSPVRFVHANQCYSCQIDQSSIRGREKN